MTAVRVHILTTQGPATVQGLVVESYDNDVLATICLDGTTEQLPICRDYHMFVDQFIRPLTGERRYRMDIDNRIDGGKSWHLGVLIAHLLAEDGRLATDGQSSVCALFVTGRIRRQPSVDERVYEVLPVDGIAEKIAASRALIEAEQEAGRKVAILLPTGNMSAESEQLKALLPSGNNEAELIFVSDADEALKVLELSPVKNDPSLPPTSTRMDRGSWFRYLLQPAVLAMLTVLFIVGLAAGCYVAWQHYSSDWQRLWDKGRYVSLTRSLASSPDPMLADLFRWQVREQSGRVGLPFVLSAMRPADGGSCAGLRFRGGGLVSTKFRSSSDGELIAENPGSLCSLAFLVTNKTAASLNVRFVAARNVVRKGRSGDVWRTAVLAPGKVMAVDVPLSLYRQDNEAWRVIIVGSPAPSENLDKLVQAEIRNSDPPAGSSVSIPEDLWSLGLAFTEAMIRLRR
ncbi:hypothetical protein N9452_07240 [Alphaproteobacteria bacterium]|nr:hypothetical protein [Alphaproteobacteria bacterium]